ncbi:MAG: GNAT family N-acetyltransferase [Acidimicrobiales bacterium]|nr:GNAT family N-acetyltransferase [Acidimicrobiales bacterium]
MAVDDRRRHLHTSLRTSTWRGDERVALLSPTPNRPTPTAHDVALHLDGLRLRNTERVVTSALHRHELEPFLANGFVEHERLHLLRHDLLRCPALRPDVPIRRGRRRDRDAVLALDARAFDDFWVLDSDGLDDAIHATPSSRFRVLGRRSESVLGYSVTGIAARRGYLQRLAVDPLHQGRGLGRAMVAESLAELRRAGAVEALVNTQERNQRAYDLYVSCGFVPEPDWLTVLTYPLGSSS